FHDGDFYKVFESLASIYAVTKDKSLLSKMDGIIEVIAASQREDGYIHTPVIIESKKEKGEKAAFEDRLNFETYNMGHLMTAACVHYRATGKRNLLEVAIKATDFLYDFYKKASPELARNAICPSHYMGVVEMYRTTGDSKYLELSKSLIDIRGLMTDGTDDNQDRIPFREQTVAMGHAVRANYLYAGVADIYSETGDTSLLNVLNLVWNNVVNTKLYITGACGALYDGVSPDGTSYEPIEVQKVHQAYGRDFQLPNLTAHNETCANIGNLLWNWRMLQITGDSKYADILELSLYNSILSGVSLSGYDFCYTNPLAVSGSFPYKMRWSGGRIPYIALSNCCPPNTVRTLSEVHNYAYSLSNEGIYFNLYGGNKLNTTLSNGKKIELTQSTEYPWNGSVDIHLDKIPQDLALYFRIPQWCKDASILINGEMKYSKIKGGTYFPIKHKWKKNDKISLILPMEVKLIESNPLVEETKGQVAVKRGPIVYCMETVDNGANDIFQVALDANSEFKLIQDQIDNSNYMSIEATGYIKTDTDWENKLYREFSTSSKKIPLRFIPYYAWGNRGDSDMTVWTNLKQ
ncbi:MAG: glycoside hydrolase family 127 protein, partial [Bacteroidales bacterium]|nr:glycoside hydrolase family 127 protein [Bacteroidales bacterium]